MKSLVKKNLENLNLFKIKQILNFANLNNIDFELDERLESFNN